MKIKFSPYIIAPLVLFAMTFPVKAQTVTNIPNFFSQATEWATSFDTNSTALYQCILKVDTGVKDVQNQITASTFDITATVHRFGAATNWTVEVPVDIDNAGVAGTVLDAQAGVQLGVIKYDLEVYGKLTGGYDLHEHSAIATPAIGLYKVMTKNTYDRLELGFPIERHTSGIPSLVASVGILF